MGLVELLATRLDLYRPRARGRILALAMLLVPVVAAACASPRVTVAPSPAGPSGAEGGTPSPTSVATAVDPEPPPPDGFDPEDVPVFSYVRNGTVGVWVEPVGLPDRAVPLVPPEREGAGGYGPARHAGEPHAVAIFTPASGPAVLRLLEAGRAPVDLVDRVIEAAVAVAPAAEVAAVARTSADDRDAGVWVVPLDGRPPVQVLPTGDAGADRGPLALAPDGRSIAASLCPLPTQVAFANGRPGTLPPGEPVGFDPGGNLVALAGCDGGTPSMWRAGAERAGAGAVRGEALGPDGAGYRAIVTPNGRFLGAINDELLPGVVLVRDLASGAERRLPLAPGAWDFTTDSTDRYVVLRRDDGQGLRSAYTWAVADVDDGWIGYLHVDSGPP